MARGWLGGKATYPSNINSLSIVAEDHNHVIVVAVATVVAVEATITVAQADTKVVSLSGGYGHGQSIEERAATLIQSYYKGYLATFNPN
ncbi:hypothetical protein FXO38_10040 [Capsicum annuum]|nr:hypothetical protein FXO38_10040 [Capsicum annuum]